ncbi:probable endo-1,3(4)-beta-glucanase An02g00850 isoform X3 [Centrocercus urophasianus]|uniref:probable endo-1,3(4)-beta-glucanase An02g00850 isoform X3 n=1 Tax=Centrocercus urophasianus TaxID=9002 RepID=UPI001C649528|nr:probable endo-1,3(4)-beta-glucanase An02g00850 isoform X3 [Centrocercus urophasianus]
MSVLIGRRQKLAPLEQNVFVGAWFSAFKSNGSDGEDEASALWRKQPLHTTAGTSGGATARTWLSRTALWAADSPEISHGNAKQDTKYNGQHLVCAADSTLRTAGSQRIWAAKPDSILQPAKPSSPTAAASVFSADSIPDPSLSAFLSAAATASVSSSTASDIAACVFSAAVPAAPSAVPNSISSAAVHSPAAPTESASLLTAAVTVTLPAAAAANSADSFLGSFSAVVFIPSVTAAAAAACIFPATLPPSSGVISRIFWLPDVICSLNGFQ